MTFIVFQNVFSCSVCALDEVSRADSLWKLHAEDLFARVDAAAPRCALHSSTRLHPAALRQLRREELLVCARGIDGHVSRIFVGSLPHLWLTPHALRFSHLDVRPLLRDVRRFSSTMFHNHPAWSCKHLKSASRLRSTGA